MMSEFSATEMMRQLHAGEITPEEAAAQFKAYCESLPEYKPAKQFDQLERRLLLGRPIVDVEGLLP